MNLTRRVTRAIFTGLVVLAGASSVAAQTYVENGVQGAGNQPVIITVTPGSETDVINTLKKHGHTVKSQLPSINGLSTDINGSDVVDLAQHGAVTITRDQTVHLTGVNFATVTTKSIDPNLPQAKNISTLRLSLGLAAGAPGNTAPGVINGKGVRIAVIDSGIDLSNGDFAGRVQNWHDYVANKTAAYDDLGHGTHVAGLIASSGVATNYMFQGVAPNVTIVPLKVLDAQGSSTTSRVIRAIDDVVSGHLADVINLSLGHPITAPAKFDPLVQAIESAVRAGIVVVVAAGNDGAKYGTINSPGNAPSAITVGAADGKLTVTRSDDYVIDFSSRGPTWYDGLAKPDVVAPGVNLYSDNVLGSTLDTTTPATWKQTVNGANLIALSGTSMSAAVATGVIALELDANTHQASAALTPNAAKAILEYTAIKLSNADVLTQGAGQVNGGGASVLAGAINTASKTGTWWLASGVTGMTAIGGSTLAWSQNIIWGTSLIGGRFVYYNNLAWDDNIIWGTGTVKGSSLVGSRRIKLNGRSADNIIWGTDFQLLKKNVVFGADDDNIIWGTSANLAQFRVVGERIGNHIVWDNADGDNIIWGTLDDDNIIWGTDDGDNIIWGTWAKDDDNIIWGTTGDDNIIWGTSSADDNIIWGTSAALNKLIAKKNSLQITFATDDTDNIIWGTAAGDNIIWGTSDDNIIWGTDGGDNIIWGTADLDNIIWGTANTLDNIIWGTSVKGGK